MMITNSHFSPTSPGLKMRFHNFYLISCTVLVSFLFDAAQTCWDTKSAPDLGETTRDYDLLVGNDLVLNCTLKRTNLTETYQRYVSSSDLVFEKDSEDFSKFTRKIDNLTLQLTIPRAKEENSGLYICKLFINNTTKPVVCGSQVNVGYPPQNVSNFTCINRNYESFKCSWNTEKNNVKTKYSIVRYLMGIFPQMCLNNSTVNSCEWSKNDSAFLQFGSTISFTVTGINSLGTSENNFTLNSSAIVITKSPENLRNISINSQSVTVRWSPPTLVTGDEVNLRYQICVSSNFSDISVYDAGNNTSHFTISNLIPYIPYNISIRCRSVGTDKEDMWSPFASIIVKTPADVPYKTPEVIPEAYELHYYPDSRSVSLYWKYVPEMNHNGEKFHYYIKYFQNVPEKSSSISSINSSNPFVIIENLQRNVPYIFHLYSANEKGLSKDYKTISVASESEILPAPTDVRVISLDRGLYNLSWNSPDDIETYKYTVFWCSSLTPWRKRCDSSIHWLNESILDTNTIINLSDLKTNYQFAVASKIERKSSGMAWASCIVPQKGGLSKIKYVLVEPKSSTSLKVIWRLDCPAHKSFVKEYEITYCKLKDCKVVVVKDRNAEDFTLKNLLPISNYSIKIQAVSHENNKSENSDPVYQITLPGAPSGPPQNIRIYSNSTTSFMISWTPPIEPNGIITKYIISYNGTTKLVNAIPIMEEYSLEVDGLKPYSVYVVQIEACVNSDCSEKSEAITVQTDIDVPGFMEPPRIEEVNSTHLKVSWIAPGSPNGPVDYYIIKWLEENQNNTSDHPNTLEVSGVNSVILDVKCRKKTEDATKYLFYIQSVNLKNGTYLFGPFSESTQAKACQDTGQGMIVGIIIGACLVGIFVLLCIYKAVVWVRSKIRQVKCMQIRLPEGLEGPETNPLNNYEFFKNGLNESIAVNNNERLSYIIDENKNRHGSGSSQFSNSSTEELMFKNVKCMKFGRKPSGDSSGCSSMSSNATPRIQLSSDSGTESDFAVPPSPDSGMHEQSLHNLHKPPLPILMEVHDQTSSEKQGQLQELSQDKHLLKYKAANDGMILKVDHPYSKFGVAGNSSSSVNPLAFYNCNLANSEPSVFDVQKPDKSDTVMTPYSKVGLAKSSGDLLGLSAINQIGYSKFGFPVSQKRFSIPPSNVNPIAMLLLEKSDRTALENIKSHFNVDCVHSKGVKQMAVDIPSSDLLEDSGYIKFGKNNFCPKKPSQGYVPFHNLKCQMEQNPLQVPVCTTDQVKDAYCSSKNDESQLECPNSTDWSTLNQCEEENSREYTPDVLFDVPFLLNSANDAIIDDGIVCNSDDSSINLSCSQNSNESLTKIASDSDIGCVSDSSTSSEVTSESNPFLNSEISTLPIGEALCPIDIQTQEKSHLCEIPNKINNYGVSNEVIVNPGALRNGYVPFHSLTDSSLSERTLNFLKVPEPNVHQTVLPKGICTGADNYLTPMQRGEVKFLKDCPLPKSDSAFPFVNKDSSSVEKPIQKENGYSNLSLKYILKTLPKMETEICEV